MSIVSIGILFVTGYIAIVRPVKAVAVNGEERGRVVSEYNMGFVLRLICGFAPSKFLQLMLSPWD